jgi:high-affinity K+ transport system ATPase subunit B
MYRNSFNMAENEKPKPIDYNSLIDELIKKIDNEKSFFKLRDQLYGNGTTLFVVVSLFFLAVIILVFKNAFGSSDVEQITLIIAILAFLITYVTFTLQGNENNVVDANFGKAVKKFKIEKKEEEKRLLLRALLTMKATNQHYKLETAKKLNEEMFTKEKLLEKLYE